MKLGVKVHRSALGAFRPHALRALPPSPSRTRTRAPSCYSWREKATNAHGGNGDRFVCLFVCLYGLFVCLCGLFVWFVCMVCLFVCMVCLFVCMVCLFVCLYGLFVCLFVWFVCMVCLFVCLFVWFVCMVCLFVCSSSAAGTD
jgi:hypothetical protein